MTVLRSREIVPNMELQTPAKNAKSKDTVGVYDPGTPAKDIEGLNHQSIPSPPTLSPKASALGVVELGSGNVLRRSRRLASKLESGLIEDGVGVEVSVISIGRKRKKSDADANLGTPVAGNVGVDGKGKLQMKKSYDRVPDEVKREVEVLGGEESGLHTDLRCFDNVDRGINGNRKRKIEVKTELSDYVPAGHVQDQIENKILHLRSGKKVIKGEVNPSNVDASQRVESIGGDGFFSRSDSRGISIGCSENGGKKLSSKDKGKGKLVEDDSFASSIDMEKLKPEAKESDGNTTGGDKGKGKVGSIDMEKLKPEAKESDGNTTGGDKGKGKVGRINMEKLKSDAKESDRNTTGGDKGKGKVVANSFTSSSTNDVGKGAESRGNSSFSGATSSQIAGQRNTSVNPRERFRDIARRNASRFAHFSAQEDEDNHDSDVPHREIPSSGINGEEEDWPGPFSTAMKIIKDRQNLSLHQQNTSLYRRGVAPVLWMPRKDGKGSFSKQSVPSLQDICVGILVKHADAITSLNGVPDVLRLKISHLLSDSRRMNRHFLNLLVQGSPTEIRVRDCSWLSEEIFTEIFQGCDCSNLTVLQLDQCGRCLPDYTLSNTLACSPNNMSALTTVSLRAAYRLSDVGLSALVSSAASLRSVDLSQCSLLTSDGICCLAICLGSVLRELYLDNCEGIDAMLILPALLNFQNLEVLSLSGSDSVCDDFLCKFMSVRGHSIKELVLADCMKLTDASVRVIAETCSELCALDLSNLRKLTDTAIGYLTNGCRAIQTLKMRHNSFSDEAVAAYLETCGDYLRELSLSNVEQVAQNTAISLSRHSRNLNYLDVSWCRNLTNEALGLIVDNCSSLKELKVFGCTQITDVFVSGHSNEEVQIIGLKMTPILEHFKEPDRSHGPLRYSAV